MAVETGTGAQIPVATGASDPPTAIEAPGSLGEKIDSPGGRVADRLISLVPLAVVTACCVFLFWEMRPLLLFRDTTAAGGDTAAHVWFPAYLRDTLLGHFRVAGWSPDWFAGFPAGQFYFPLPALATLVGDLFLPYNVTFKLVSVSGVVALPAAAYTAARGLRVRMPGPVLCAPAAVAFLFFKGDPGTSDAAVNHAFNQGIMGGTLRSTLAGEFSFTIALAFALFFIGALAVALRDRKRLWLPAMLLACVVLSHIIVGMFAAVAAIIIWAFHRPTRTALTALVIGGTGALLTAAWSLPLLSSFGYTANMRYTRISDYVTYLFPTYLWWVFALAFVAIVAASVRRDRGVFVILTLSATFALVFRFWPELHAWNLRFLPFWYLGLYLLAGIGAAEIVHGARAVASWVMTERGPERPSRAPLVTKLVTGGLAAVVVLGLTMTVLVRSNDTMGFLRFWVDWNYTGYEDTTGVAGASHRPKAWPEFDALMSEMAALPPGRALWEGGGDIDAYGSSLALMLLPYFTDGRISSMEGLYYESSATTPYHFMAVATLEGPGNASNPVRGLNYRTIDDFDLGVTYLRQLGVSYYLAHSEEAKDKAGADSGLTLLATVPDVDGVGPDGWSIYEVADAPLVEPLRYEPVVATGIGVGTQSECFGDPKPEAVAGQAAPRDPELTAWECVAAPWWDDPAALDRPLAESGPADWVRAPVDEATNAPRIELPEIEVTNVVTDDDSVSFDVSEIGVPVLVKVSSYPNWSVSGAEGPYRVTPNFMVVVPTSRHVKLTYDRTPAELAGMAGSLIGIAALVGLVIIGRRSPRWLTRDPAAVPAGRDVDDGDGDAFPAPRAGSPPVPLAPQGSEPAWPPAPAPPAPPPPAGSGE